MKTGILLINLGTPDSPCVSDVKRYLIEFLTDPMVLDVPWLWRQILVRGLIVPKRKYESSKSYRRIWTENGSPLLMWGERVKQLLQEALGDPYQVELAMRYQNPSIKQGLSRLRHLPKLVILPLFPQYASASTGTALGKVMDEIKCWNVLPELKIIQSYPMQNQMIAAFCDRARQFPIQDYDHILMSFHGLPERQIRKADLRGCCFRQGCCDTLGQNNAMCYKAQCHATARAIAEGLDLAKDCYTVTFQSRLGKDPWIRPYTQEKVEELASHGAKKLLAFSPAFVCDCLETTDEIGTELSRFFIKLGGEKLDLVPGLNDHTLWIDALVELVKEGTAFAVPQDALEAQLSPNK